MAMIAWIKGQFALWNVIMLSLIAAGGHMVYGTLVLGYDARVDLPNQGQTIALQVKLPSQEKYMVAIAVPMKIGSDGEVQHNPPKIACRGSVRVNMNGQPYVEESFVEINQYAFTQKEDWYYLDNGIGMYLNRGRLSVDVHVKECQQLNGLGAEIELTDYFPHVRLAERMFIEALKFFCGLLLVLLGGLEFLTLCASGVPRCAGQNKHPAH